MKGAGGIQPCTWGVTVGLWAGRVSDTNYHEGSGYVQAMQKFQEEDLVPVSADSVMGMKYEVVPFTQVLDKGYQVTRFNYDHGKQRTVQPVFGKSNQKFRGEDTLFSGMVASLRSGNERWILVCKRPGLIKEGFKPGMCPKVFDDVWLGWGFHANFMYKPAM